MNTVSFAALLAIGSSAVFAQQQAPEPGGVGSLTWKRAGGKLADVIREVAMGLLSQRH